MLPKRKMGFGYIVGKLIICSVWNQCHYFSKEVMKVFIRLRRKVPSIWKINIKILIDIRRFFFQNICQIFCTCVLNNFEIVLND